MNYITTSIITTLDTIAALVPFIIGAIGVGAGLGIIGWVGLKIWSQVVSLAIKANGVPRGEE